MLLKRRRQPLPPLQQLLLAARRRHDREKRLGPGVQLGVALLLHRPLLLLLLLLLLCFIGGTLLLGLLRGNIGECLRPVEECRRPDPDGLHVLLQQPAAGHVARHAAGL